MKKAILGKKLGMTQIFGENDVAIPVTVVQCGPMTVVDTRTVERNGYSAVVCAFEEIKEGKLNKPEAGLYKKAKAKPARYLREFRFEDADAYEVGKVIDCTIFGDGDMVDVSGVTKGRGFTGVIKRWNHSPQRRFDGRKLQSVAPHQELEDAGTVRSRKRHYSKP